MFSNFDSGQALVGRGLVSKEWFSIELILKDKQYIQLVKVTADDFEKINEFYFDLKTLMDDWFHFVVDYEEIQLNNESKK